MNSFNKLFYLTSLKLYDREIGRTLGQRIPNFTAHQLLRGRILGLNNQACLEAFTCIILQHEKEQNRGNVFMTSIVDDSYITTEHNHSPIRQRFVILQLIYSAQSCYPQHHSIIAVPQSPGQHCRLAVY